MSDQSYAVRAARLLEDIMEQLEAVEALEDADIDLVDGVLTVEFEDGGQLIINRQEPLEQLWLASPEGPAHFDYNDEAGEWRNDKTGESLVTTLERVLTEKLGQPVSL